MLTQDQIRTFQAMIWDFYHTNGRIFAWRNNTNPYHIFISEVMLQQTQTYRVEPKFEQFITIFPDFNTLAQASLFDVLTVWQGLGYNRRAKFLYQAADIIVKKYNGIVPHDPLILITLPGIGPATAASIGAFAYNKPTVFIETNIRTVFIDTFFSKTQDPITDAHLLPLIEQTVDKENPREWYYALMDYGVYLKKTNTNPSRRSKHYTKQSVFKGSVRQIRGNIIAFLLQKKKATIKEMIAVINDEQQRTGAVIDTLLKEQIIFVENDFLCIK